MRLEWQTIRSDSASLATGNARVRGFIVRRFQKPARYYLSPSAPVFTRSLSFPDHLRTWIFVHTAPCCGLDQLHRRRRGRVNIAVDGAILQNQ